MSADDGHGPKYGCTYQACGNPESANPCPFVKSYHAQEFGAVADQHFSQCQHEWRQRWVVDTKPMSDEPVALPDGFYCIHCLEVTKNLLEHNYRVRFVANRGDSAAT